MASCAIVTTEPVDAVRPIHDRIPLVLSPENRDRWLDPESDPCELTAIARHPDGEALEARPVSTLVNAPANDELGFIEYSRQAVPRGSILASLSEAPMTS